MIKVGAKISRTVIVIAIIVLIGFFYGISIKTEGRLPVHQQIIIGLITPFQKSVSFLGRGVSGLWNDYVNLVDAQKENAILSQKTDEQSNALIQMSELLLENNRLRALLQMKEKFKLDVIGATVISNDPRGDFRVVTVDRGADDGVLANMPVVTYGGLVGRVIDSTGGSSRVLLITDPNSAEDVMVERSRFRALLVGQVKDTGLNAHYYMSRLEYLDRLSDIVDGDTIITSGMDEIFPPGIPVGQVTNVEKGSLDVFKRADVIPFVDFSNLEEVMIVKR